MIHCAMGLVLQALLAKTQVDCFRRDSHYVHFILKFDPDSEGAKPTSEAAAELATHSTNEENKGEKAATACN